MRRIVHYDNGTGIPQRISDGEVAVGGGWVNVTQKFTTVGKVVTFVTEIPVHRVYKIEAEL